MAIAKKPSPRTYARNRAVSRRGNEKLYEYDTQYLLKLVGVLILGTLWLKFASPLVIDEQFIVTAIPLGLIIGLVVVSKFESLQANRRIWYAVLAVMTLVSYFLPAGIVI